MQELTVAELASISRTPQEKVEALLHFKKTAFPTVPASEIISVFKKNRPYWQALLVRPGSTNDQVKYTQKILTLADHIRENIISVIVLAQSKDLAFLHDLKEYADDFSTELLENEKVMFTLYFVK